ncbi:MAG TPA: carboxypeptidase-like regulatory domain-containing protein [Blastocatellia bacterium]|nr:carboxypeptidase-like regulatory domain-containing protein [Blastocatellia bacterium]
MKRLAVAMLAFFVFELVINAQSNTGRLAGMVSGPDGVIAGATVSVIDQKTGKVRTAATSAEGTFAVPQLEVGIYTINISAEGFKTSTATGVKIDVGQEYSLIPTLEIGPTQESVTIIAGPSLINSANAELSTTISPQQVSSLPLNGLNPFNLAMLLPGTSYNGTLTASFDGQRLAFVNITRDGINVTDNFVRQLADALVPGRPTVDEIGELTVTSQNASAAQTGSAQAQLVTPRGQRDFHGGLFHFNRNSFFSANDLFNNAANNPRPFQNRNQFGGNISGPAVFRDRLFFFGSYEGSRRRGTSQRRRLILTPAARNGIFTFNYLDPATGANATQSVNLFALPAFPGIGGAPAPRGIDPVVQNRILANLPTAGNFPRLGDGLNITGYLFDQALNSDRDNYTTRIDTELNNRQTLNFIYSFKGGWLLRPELDLLDGFGAMPVATQPESNHLFVTAYRYTASANLTNEVRGGFFLNRPSLERRQGTPPFFIGGAISPAAAANDPIIPANSAVLSNPEVPFAGQARRSYIYNLQDNADYQRGTHALRFGFSGQFYRHRQLSDSGLVPTVYLGLNTSTPRLTAASFAPVLPANAGISPTTVATANLLYSILGGVVGLAKQTFNAAEPGSGFTPGLPGLRGFAWENYGFYLADQWRARRSLTVNLGLRYEYQTPLRSQESALYEPVLQGDPVRAILDPNGRYASLGANAGGRNVYRPDRNNFAPVFSLAYAPDFKTPLLNRLLPGGRTVLRGGFRMNYINDEITTLPRNANLRGVTLAATQTLNLPTGPVTTSQLNARLNAPPLGFNPANLQTPSSFADTNTTAFGNFGTVSGVDPNLRTPQTYEYNIGLQREFDGGIALEVRYVGNHGNNLIRATDYNQIRIDDNGFLADFLRARNNLQLSGGTNYNCSPAFAGCQGLQIIGTPRLGTINGATIIDRLRAGVPADLAADYVTTGQTNGFPFLPNPNAGPAELLQNSGRYNYHSLQVEVRRRYSRGLYLQGNYTFQKVLTDTVSPGPLNISDRLLDLRRPELEYARADFDTAHVFNFNGIYELPVGKGRPFLNREGLVNTLLGGWQLTGIVRVATGAPLTITDPRGTLNRAARSTRQTAASALSKDQIKNLIGVRRTKCGIFLIDPSVVDINLSNCSGTGQASRGFGQPAFPGQAFFNVAPGQTGNLERAFINGPVYSNLDASFLKNFQLAEGIKFQFRTEVFNLFNHANFGVDNLTSSQFGLFNINSPTFGRLTTTVSPNETFRVLQFGARLQF